MNNSNDTTIKSLTIVGAGTTGTMAAAYLSKTLPRKIKITLIAPEKNERTGVGEATVPSIRFFMRTLGLKENDWMHKVNATYKCGIKFTNWNQEQGSYYHPFFKKKNTRSNMLGFSFEQDPEDILNYNLNGASHKDFLNSSTLALSICENYLSPKSKANKSHVNYAYHFDAQLFADFLMAFAENQGVEIIRGDVEKVEFFENGFINSLKLASGNSIQSDFFIDCTGFKGKLIEDSLAVPFRDYSARLFTDSAIAVNISKDFKKKPAAL